MNYLDFLRKLHERLEPRTYLEVGIRAGGSLALARGRTRSVGIDPDFKVTHQVAAPTSFFRTTSDDYFAQLPPAGPFDGTPTDLAFIDGMHLFEFALRDFINIERLATWSSVAVFDDVLPRSAVMANRERDTTEWTGDVYKVEQVLRRMRRDLAFLTVDTEPTGLLLVFGLDANSNVLPMSYDDLVTRYVVPDPQTVPRQVLDRAAAITPQAALAAPVWELIRSQREGKTESDGRSAVRKEVRRLDAGASGFTKALGKVRRRRAQGSVHA